MTFELRRAIADAVRRRDRAWRTLNQRLEAHDLRRRLATIHGRLNAADGRLQAAVLRRRERAHAAAATLAGRLETLSPLGVLARGYALCWNEDRTAVLRRATSVAAGDRVPVTLHEGELACEVREVIEPPDR